MHLGGHRARSQRGAVMAMAILPCILACAENNGQMSPQYRVPQVTMAEPDTAAESGYRDIFSSTAGDNSGVENSISPVRSARLPPSEARLVRIAVQFVRAIGTGDVTKLSRWVAAGALSVDSRGRETPLLARFAQRFQRFDYRITLENSPLFEPDIEVVETTDSRARRVAVQLHPKTYDQLVLLPFVRPKIAGQELFGSEMWLLLREVEERWLIVSCYDDTSP